MYFKNKNSEPKPDATIFFRLLVVLLEFLEEKRIKERSNGPWKKEGFNRVRRADLFSTRRDGSISPLDSGLPVNSPPASRASENSNWKLDSRRAGILAASPWRVRGGGGGCGRRATSVDGLAPLGTKPAGSERWAAAGWRQLRQVSWPGFRSAGVRVRTSWWGIWTASLRWLLRWVGAAGRLGSPRSPPAHPGASIGSSSGVGKCEAPAGTQRAAGTAPEAGGFLGARAEDSGELPRC